MQLSVKKPRQASLELLWYRSRPRPRPHCVIRGHSSPSQSTSIPSGILIHPAIWPQQIWAENWGLCPFGGGELGPHPTQYGQPPGPQHTCIAKFHLNPSNRLATIHQHYRHKDRTDRQDRQWSDSIGQSVLRTAAQKVLQNNKR